MAKYDSAWEQQLKMSQPINLSDATVFDILSRLPVKSILRFKSACKKWDALFRDPQFIDAHLHRSVESSDCCCLIQERNPHEFGGTLRCVFSLSKAENFDDYQKLHCNPEFSHGSESVASINGIMCIAKIDYSTLTLLGILLWNPATRESRILPKSPCNLRPRTCMGFGFDPKNNDYKVMAISISECSSEVNVYSLKTDSWRVIEATSYELQQNVPIVNANGRMHWFASVNFQILMIVSFDVAEEKFIPIDMPEIEYPNDYALDLCEAPATLGESLILSICEYDKGCEIWFMKEYGDSKSWSKLYYISLIPMCGRFIKPSIFLDNRNILVQGEGITLLWGPMYQDFKFLNVDFGALIFKYKESLVSIRGGGSISNHGQRAGFDCLPLLRNGVDGENKSQPEPSYWEDPLSKIDSIDLDSMRGANF